MSVVVTTFVHGWYVDYVPMFIYSVLKAYPDYFVKVFVQGEMSKHNKEALELISNNRFEVVEHFFDEYKQNEASKKPYYLRWLIPHNHLKEFTYAFICDVDLIMLREEPTLVEQRISNSHGLPYTNFMRAPHPNYPSRISGWHFIEVEEYYEKAEPIIQRVLNDSSFDISNPPSYSYDNGTGERQWGQEALLHSIIDAAFGIDERIDERRNSYPYHHGLHLGPFRGRLPQRMRSNDSQAKQHIGRNSIYWERTSDILSVIKDKDFQKITAEIKEDKVKNVLNNLKQHVLLTTI